MQRTHKVKILPQYFGFVERRIKNAEVRLDDRRYIAGDQLVLEEWNNGEYTGRFCVRTIRGVFPLDPIGFKNWVLLCLE